MQLQTLAANLLYIRRSYQRRVKLRCSIQQLASHVTSADLSIYQSNIRSARHYGPKSPSTVQYCTVTHNYSAAQDWSGYSQSRTATRRGSIPGRSTDFSLRHRVQWVVLVHIYGDRSVKLTTHLHLVPRIRMREALPPTPTRQRHDNSCVVCPLNADLT
jgi:hypothetical protein